VIIFFTGCFNIEKGVVITITPPSKVISYQNATFSVTLQSSLSGGIGDVFAKDAAIKEYTWIFNNTTRGTVTEKKSTTKTLTTQFIDNDEYILSVKVVTDGGQTYETSDKKKISFSVEKLADKPVLTLSAFDAESIISEIEDWDFIKKNQTVLFSLSVTDGNIPESEIEKYQIKWILQQSVLTTEESEEYTSRGWVNIHEQAYKTVAEDPSFEHSFNQIADYKFEIYVKDAFGNVYSYIYPNPYFVVSSAIPPVPEVLSKGWSTDNLKYQIVVKRPSDYTDVSYYRLYRYIGDAIIEEDLTYVFPNEDILLEDSTVSKGTSKYKIAAFSTGGISREIVETWVIPNRPPSKANIVQPKGIVTQAINLSSLQVTWNNATDPDLDPVEYFVYFGQAADQTQLNCVGKTTAFSYGVTGYNIESGKEYYIRVDSHDSEGAQNIGNVVKFSFLPDINPPYFVQPQNYPFVEEVRVNGEVSGWLVQNIAFSFSDPYPLLGVYKVYEIQFSKYGSFPGNQTDVSYYSFAEGPGIHTYDDTNAPTLGNIFIPNKNNGENKPQYLRIRAVFQTDSLKVTSGYSVPRKIIPYNLY